MRGRARGAKAPLDFLANVIKWGCGHTKVGVVVHKKLLYPYKQYGH